MMPAAAAIDGKAPGATPSGRFAFVIPVYNHAACVAAVIRRAREPGVPVVVVDDGSTDATRGILEALRGILLIRHPVNRGKGAALVSGMTAAASLAEWAVTVDADGQHDPADAALLRRAIPAGARPIVIGARRRMLAAGAPWASRVGRGFSNFWVRCAGGPAVSDSQSGFRIYPLPETLSLGAAARRFQVEVEILVMAHRRGIPVVEAAVAVCYRPGSGRVSHFRPLADSLRNAGTFSRLIAARILNPRSGRAPTRPSPEAPCRPASGR